MFASWFRAAFYWWGRGWARRRIRASFDGLHVEGLHHLVEAAAKGPVLLAANHVSWWDALLMVELSRRAGLRTRVLVDRANLEHHRFFSAFGAVALDLHDPKPGIARAAATLRGPGDVLWVFPQGRYLPAHLRPLRLQSGVDWLRDLTGASVLPVALQYAFLKTERPAAFAHLGPPTGHLEADLASLLDGIDEAVIERTAAEEQPNLATRWLSGAVRRLEGPLV